MSYILPAPFFYKQGFPTKAMNAKGFLILIHTPHARSDSEVPYAIHAGLYFNPRSSCEERLSDSQALQVAGF